MISQVPSHVTGLAVMDAAVMVLLAAVIVFAVRLSRQLSAFRAGRDELRGLIGELTGSVARAEAAIAGMKTNAQVAGRELQARIDAARSLSDELQLVAEAEGNRDARRAQAKPQIQPQARRAADKPATLRGEGPGFAIRDRETERGDAPPDNQFLSQAERDLYEAMRGRERDRGAS